MNKKTRSPLFHITKRDALPWYKSWGIRAAAILLALIVCSIITTTMTGENPLQVYATIFNGSFGSPRKVWVLLQNIAMLLCIALAVTPAFKMRFWNIGGEGQVLAGALAAADDVPQRDAGGGETLEALRVGELRPGAEERAHDRPEGVARVRVILRGGERGRARQTAEHQHARVGAELRGKAAHQRCGGRAHQDLITHIGTASSGVPSWRTIWPLPSLSIR